MCEKEIKNIFQAGINKQHGLEILKKFKEQNKIDEKEKGVYAIYFKDDDSFKKFSKETEESKVKSKIKKTKCNAYINERINEINAIPENNEHKNLFYIGQTKTSFKQRVTEKSGHKGGGYTSFNITLLRIFLGENSKTSQEFTKKKMQFLGNKKWTNFFNDYFKVTFLPLENVSTINLVESYLIYLFQPPMNKEGCDDYLILKDTPQQQE